MRTIDAHIHLDKYEGSDLEQVLAELGTDVEAVIAVSVDQASCETNLDLAERYSGTVLPAFGFHPEQPIPAQDELDRLFVWIEQHREEAVAIGEVGLPYYNRTDAEKRGERFDLEPYIALLERFVELAVRLDKPIVLHTIYEDADITCDLLEKHGCRRAHFHYFKGANHTIERMAANGYYISITPDVLYEEEIRELVRKYPIDLIMAETDGPWPFEGPCAGKLTTPAMTRYVVEEIAVLRGLPASKVEEYLYRNTKRLYQLDEL